MYMTHRDNILFQAETATKRENHAVTEAAVMAEKGKSLILSKFGQHVEITDWIIGTVIRVRSDVNIRVEIADLCRCLRRGFSSQKMDI